MNDRLHASLLKRRFINCLADMGDHLSIKDIVGDMRESRNYMVQSQIQYVYCYQAAYDAIERMLNDVLVVSFPLASALCASYVSQLAGG